MTDAGDGSGGLPGTTKASLPLSILLVDDNVDLGEMLGEALRRLGHEVWVVHGAEEALRRAREQRCDVVVLDIGLPLMDGHEVARVLRSYEGGAALHLVAMSGYSRAGERERALAAGFDVYLVKPVTVQALSRAVIRAGRRP